MPLIITSPRQSTPRLSPACVVAALALVLSSCMNQDAPVADKAHVAAPPAATRPAATATAAVPQDSFQRDSQSIVGITYPAGLERHPGLAPFLVDYAHAQRATLADVLALNPNPTAPYELSLRFTVAADSARLYAVRADGETYTGGRGSRPNKAAFVWLPTHQRLLKPEELIVDPAGWALVRRALHDAKVTLPRKDDLPPLIPLLNSSGQIAALGFMLDDGDVRIPASQLRPYAAAQYASWFATDAATAAVEQAPARAAQSSP